MSPDTSNAPEVPLPMLRRYLMARGWHLAESVRVGERGPRTNANPSIADLRQRTGGRRTVDVYVLSERGFDDIELLLPRDRDTSDCQRRLEGALEALSQLEGRDQESIIADVRSIGFDVVRSRIPDELVKEETINLVQATNYIEGVKDLLAATATTELRPDPYFLRVKKEATNYAEHCRFGHTFRGSFGFTIESPVMPNLEPMFPGVEQSPPFERRVIMRLARGIQTICDAVRGEDPAPAIERMSSGFSANVFEQFADLVEKTSHSGMNFSFLFSPEWAVPEELGTSPEFWVGPAHVETSRLAARLLRDQPLSRPEEVFGRIIRLQNETDPTDLFDRTGDRQVVVQWASEDLGDLQVRVSLSPTDYLSAIEAHKNGRPIRVQGTLERQGRLWVLSNPSDFSI